MKTFQLLKNIGLVLFLGLIVTACSSSDDSKGDCITQEDVNRYQNKIDSFTANPTRANCDAVKEAAFAYLNKLKNCPDANDAAKSLIEQWYDMDCNVFDNEWNPGSGNNNGGGNKEKRDVTFRTSDPKMVGVSVYIKGSFIGTFTKYVTYVTVINGEKDPNAIYNPVNECFLPGLVTTSLEVGTYTYFTSNGRSDTFTVFPASSPYSECALYYIGVLVGRLNLFKSRKLKINGEAENRIE
ncbi:hypothetical protein [Myroides indicus]|uniref:Lipoprotein n=1 Tax=Myroides indicus TaxID=1323422 RepID=A0A4R7F601_9FLAO|nr:hypothetical protein [Myroides indicus]TDS65084.1 hypothetical protein C8P70_103106 [Myroides indicus]